MKEVYLMKRNKLIPTLTALVLAGTLSACSTPVTSASNDNHAPVVAGQTQATQGTDSHPSPSARPDKSSMPRVDPITKGVVTDGKDSWVQTSIDKTDPDFLVDLSNVDDATKAKLSEAELQAAWEPVAKFLAEEGIDSPLRSAAAADNPEIFKKWVADNSNRFVKGAKFVPGDANQGNTLDNVWGIKQDKKESGLSYDTAGSKPRIINRFITTGTVEVGEDGSVKFLPSVAYKMAVKNAQGTEQIASDTIKFSTTSVKEDGVWKISRNQGTFYPMQFKNVDAK
jgi:hypothetical protein